MFNNYLKLTLRNLVKNKFYSTINIFGLSVGILCATLILLYIYNEQSYDRHYVKQKNIYRLESSLKFSDNAMKMPLVSFFFGEALKRDYTEVEDVVSFR